MFRKLFFSLSALCMFPLFCFSLPSNYTIQDIGTLESDFSEALCMNENGEILGKYRFEGEEHIFLWSQSKGIRTLDDIPFGWVSNSPFLKKINNNGQILLALWKNSEQLAQMNAVLPDKILEQGTWIYYLWTPQKGLTELSSDKGIVLGADLNDNGVVVGSLFDRDWIHMPCVWDNGNIIDLETVSGDLGIKSKSGVALFVNNNMDIVGQSSKAIVYKGQVVKNVNTVVVWRAENNWEAEEIFPDGIESVTALGFNNSGNVVCRKQNGAIYLCDLKENKNYKINRSVSWGKNSPFTDNNLFMSKGDIHEIVESKDGFETRGAELSSYIPKVENRDSFWNKLTCLRSINSKGYAVGNATNVYGETHVILFVPEDK